MDDRLEALRDRAVTSGLAVVTLNQGREAVVVLRDPFGDFNSAAFTLAEAEAFMDGYEHAKEANHG